MLKDLLKEQQPVVYRALKNACQNDRVSNAYLFAGPEGTPKHEAAILLAESIFCREGDGLACEECNTCRRIREGVYGDLVILDGSEKPVSKDDVDAIQEKFSRTALENTDGKRVYIIEHAETASISAQNSMLKFLEEPGSGVTAILTAENSGRLLPTILSRCTVIPFVPMAPEFYYEKAVEAGIPEDDAYLISHIVRSPDAILSFYESDELKNALSMFKEYLNIGGLKREELLIDYEISYRSRESDSAKAKKSNIAVQQAFFGLLAQYARDVLSSGRQGPAWYTASLAKEQLPIDYYAKLLVIASEQKDRVNRFNDLNLVLAQAFFRLEELNHGYGI